MKSDLMLLALLLSMYACSAQDEANNTAQPYTSPSNTQGSVDDYYEYASAGTEYANAAGLATPTPDVEENLQDTPVTEEILINGYEESKSDNLITFAADVDTASYSIARQSLLNGYAPSPSNVRVEEFVNYFDYQDSAPRTLGEVPFMVHLDAAPSIFAEGKQLLRVGVKGYVVPEEERLPANLVFLIDISGSMMDENKLGLIKRSMALLLDKLGENDTISIVTYAGNDRIALEPTSASNREVILNVLNSLEASGSTNGSAGIVAAYDLAQRSFKTNGNNRVILCTDGDFNVGLYGDQLDGLIEEKREYGIYLTVLGFGLFYDDGTMERLADKGNGNYAFIDNINEAKRALVDRLVSTIQAIAKDVKLQLEVNPTLVKTYRLLGYENRAIADEDFRNDAVDAGEIGAGHTVVALIELEFYPEDQRPSIDEFRLSDEPANPDIPVRNTENTDDTAIVIDSRFASETPPVAFVRMRHKAPTASNDAAAIESITAILPSQIKDSYQQASRALQLSGVVAEFAEILRNSPYVESAQFDLMIDIVTELANDEADFIELIQLLEIAKDL